MMGEIIELTTAHYWNNESGPWNASNYTEYGCDLETSNPIETPQFQGTIYVMYTIIFLVAVVGNGIVCYIVLSSPRMRTVTNYFIMNLSVGDILITLFGVPFTSVSYLQQYWPFGTSLCPVVNYSQAVSVFVSAYTMLAISVDRYIAIMWPLRPRISKKISILIILAVWIFAGLTALPIYVLSKLGQPSPWYVACERYDDLFKTIDYHIHEMDTLACNSKVRTVRFKLNIFSFIRSKCVIKGFRL